MSLNKRVLMAASGGGGGAAGGPFTLYGTGGFRIVGANTSSPVQIGVTDEWADLAMGGKAVCGIKTDGTLWGWGYKQDFGSNGHTADKSTPTQIGSGTDWVQVAGLAGVGDHGGGFALNDSGAVYAWGSQGFFGSLGDGTVTHPGAGYMTQTSISNVAKVFAGRGGGGAIKTDGTLWLWGRGDRGQLGQGDAIHRSTPVQVGSDTDWVTGSVGGLFCAFIKDDDTMWMWGQGNNGQQGNGGTANVSSPVQLGGAEWKSVVCSYETVSAVKTDGTLWSWGRGLRGERGDGTTVQNQLTPVQIGTDTDWDSVGDSNERSHVFIKTDGTVWGAGDGGSGQLDNDSTANQSAPVQIGSNSGWAEAMIGGTATFLVK